MQINSNNSRRKFITSLSASLAASSLLSNADHHKKKQLFEISIAEWSLHKSLFGKKISNLDFPVVAKKEFKISAVEYVNQFFKDKATDKNYLNELKKICDNEGVKSLLIMCDGEGKLGDPDKNKRISSVNNHKRWIEAAKHLGCHSIRVNASSRDGKDARTSICDPSRSCPSTTKALISRASKFFA